MANAQVTLSLPVLRKGVEPETGPTAVKHLQLMLNSAGRLSHLGRGRRLWRDHRTVGQALSAEREPHGRRHRRAADVDIALVQMAVAVGTRLGAGGRQDSRLCSAMISSLRWIGSV